MSEAMAAKEGYIRVPPIGQLKMNYHKKVQCLECGKSVRDDRLASH